MSSLSESGDQFLNLKPDSSEFGCEVAVVKHGYGERTLQVREY
jgi:hypothetical protein